MGTRINPSEVAKAFRRELSDAVAAIERPLRLVGFLTSDFAPSVTYARYTRLGCEAVGIEFDLRKTPKFDLEQAIQLANEQPDVDGIIIYYPVFGVEQDNYIKDQIDPRKDVEGLNTHWLRKLYHNDRHDEQGNKAILPCTPLAVLKLLDAAGEMNGTPRPLEGKTVTIFNRSEVVGRPLASMMANDGAHVFSFDIYGVVEFAEDGTVESSITRADALRSSDVVITGVPSREFPLVSADEIRAEACCINFSTLRNFEKDAVQKARIFIPRVGPMTVTMALRNTVRLYRSFHAQDSPV